MKLKQATQAELIALLATDAPLQQKAQACQRLAIIGDKDAIPALAALLGDERLSDYARAGLEISKLPEAGAALRKALPSLKGSQLAGVVDSLGIRREKESVPLLVSLAKDPQRGAESGALPALGRIATPEAVAAITEALRTAGGAREHPVWHASLLAADQLICEGNKEAAMNLLKALLEAKPPHHVSRAANALQKRT